MAIGPSGSGQALPDEPALQVVVTSDVDWQLMLSAADWSGPAAMPASTLAWRTHGSADPWTSFSTTAAVAASQATPGSPTAKFDAQWSIPPFQVAGTYTNSTTITVLPRP